VCRLFADLGRVILSADEIARDVSNHDPDVRKEIASEFGPDSYLPDGTLDRQALASIVFHDAKKRARLNAIVHPRVFDHIEHQLSALPPVQAKPYVVIEAALIYETGMDESLDFVIVVAADKETCVQRVRLRDNVPAEDVKRRISAQMPLNRKIERADFVIHNDGSEADLKSRVLFLDSILSQLMTAESR
jgi:dephospho-CoA kinase